MTDYSKLTDKEINEAMQSFPNSMCLLDKKGNRKLIDYVADDGFCMRLVKGNRMDSTFDVELKFWHVDQVKDDKIIVANNKNLNRAVLELYLQIKEQGND